MENRQSFIFGTTLSSLQSIRSMQEAKAAGFTVGLYYVALDSVKTNVERVRQRVLKGGHDIPEVNIRRRHKGSLMKLTDSRDIRALQRPLPCTGRPDAGSEGGMAPGLPRCSLVGGERRKNKSRLRLFQTSEPAQMLFITGPGASSVSASVTTPVGPSVSVRWSTSSPL
ncbi:zeta toxin family protein [Rhizobium tubonense]|nr:zeta toxin family protein [Rhizobium tubonense]